jgi:outer membrane receptor protein involved in Fe transport
VIQGPSSLLYGGYSLYGMINVVTSSGESLSGTRLKVSGGSWNTYEVQGSYGASGVDPGPTEDAPGTPWSFFAAAGYYKSNGEDLNLPLVDVGVPVDVNGGTIWGGPQSGTDYERAPFAFVKASRGEVSFLARVGYRDHGEVFAKYGKIYGSPHEVREDSKSFAELKWRPKLTPHLDGSFRVFVDSYKYWSRSTYPGEPYYPELDAYFTILDADTWDTGGEASFTYRRGVHLLTFGLEYRTRNVTSVYGDEHMETHASLWPPTEDSSSGHLLVAYLQEEWRPVNQLSFILGGTFADTEPGGSKFLPRVAVIYKPQSRLSIKALYGFGFRPPSLYEAQQELETLRPEEMRSAELSLLWDVTNSVSLQAYAFDSRLSGLISYRALAGGEGGYQALDDVPGRGFGTTLQGRTGNVRGYLNVAYAKAHLERPGTPDKDIPGSSRWLASGGLSLDAGAFTTSLSARYVGEQDLDPAFYETGTAGDFVEANVRALWKTRVAFYPVTFSLDIRNLFDVEGTLAASPSQVLSFVPLQGRSAMVGCEIRF